MPGHAFRLVLAVRGLDSKETPPDPDCPFLPAILVSGAVVAVKATPLRGRPNGRALTTTDGTGQIGHCEKDSGASTSIRRSRTCPRSCRMPTRPRLPGGPAPALPDPRHRSEGSAISRNSDGGPQKPSTFWSAGASNTWGTLLRHAVPSCNGNELDQLETRFDRGEHRQPILGATRVPAPHL